MYHRRKNYTLDNLYELLMISPWWVCLIIAGIVFIILAYIIPPILSAYPLLQGVGPVSRLFAPLFAFIVLLIGIVASFNRWKSGTLLSKQKGIVTIRKLSYQEFEEIVAAVFRRQGYRVIENGKNGADGGVDLILYGNGETIIVQCKNWRTQNVGVKPLRELHGVLKSTNSDADRAIFVTSGEYSWKARRFARENSIELIAGNQLHKLVKENKDKFEPALGAAFLENSNAPNTPVKTSPHCPKCGRPMVLRIAHKGEHAGSLFWGCSGYPKCRGILNLNN